MRSVLTIHRSERVDALVDALGALLATAPADPLAPDVVAVPTRGMERWVSQRLSHRLGCDPADGDGVCANVLFPSPGDLLREAVESVGGDGLLAWAPSRLRWSVLEVVDDAAGVLALAPLTDFVEAGEAGRERRMLAASRLADAFTRYAADRPAMLVDWAAGRDTDGAGAALDHDLRWQAELYRRVRASLGTPGPAERLTEICAAIEATPDAVSLPERLSVLGPTRLTAAELAVLGALAAGRDVHLWLPHPSPAGWQRLAARGPSPTLRRRDDATAEYVSTPLLAGLGRDSLELQARIRSLDTPVEDLHHPVPGRPSTLLGALQQTFSEDRLVRPPVGRDGDASVQVHACHGPSRQVEVLREVVVGLLADDPTLEPRDVLVMVPDIEQYSPLLSATFGLVSADAADEGPVAPRHPGQRLRVRLADRSLRQTNPVLGVAADLLDLADGRLSASQVLDLASAAPVRRRFHFSDDDLERVRAWITETGIRWGTDAEHRGRAGLPGIAENTWRTGLDRLLLGVTMSEDEPTTVGGVLPYDDIGSQDVDLVGRLAEYVDRLERGTADLRQTQPLPDWVTAMVAAVESLTDVPPSQTWQTLALRRELGGLAADAGDRHADVPLDLGDVRALLDEVLAGRPTRANFRTGDLTVCSLVPMRAVPHRVVCVLGLDDGAFPRVGAVDGDDVLARAPLVGERDARSEDRQILLDAIHAATQTLVLLYTGADPRTNAARPPCVPLGELLDTLVTLTGGPGPGDDRDQARRRLVTHHPLQPFDARNFAAGALGVGRPFSFDTDTLAGARRALRSRDEPDALRDLRLPADEEDGDLQLADLVGFVEHPVKAFLRQRLGVNVGGDDADDVDDMLCVELNALEKWGVADRLLDARLAGVDAGPAAAAERVRGLLPPGRPGDAVLADRGDLVERIVAAYRATGLAEPRTVDVDARVGGRTLLGSVSGVHGRTVVRVTVSSVAAKHRLRAWVQLLALTVTWPDGGWTSQVIGKDTKDEVETYRLGPVSVANAVHWLEALLALYDRGMTMALPLAPKTSEAYARKRTVGTSPHSAAVAARRKWTSGRYAFGEAGDDAHALVWGRDAAFDVLLGVGVPALSLGDEGHAFGVLSRQLWDGLLVCEGGPV